VSFVRFQGAGSGGIFGRIRDLILDSIFIICNGFLGIYLMYLSCYCLVLSRSEIATREMTFLEHCWACSASGIGLFKISNSSKLSAEGMKPQIMCCMIDIEVTHMLGNGCVGVHPMNSDFIVSMALYNDPILLISLFSPCEK